MVLMQVIRGPHLRLPAPRPLSPPPLQEAVRCFAHHTPPTSRGGERGILLPSAPSPCQAGPPLPAL